MRRDQRQVAALSLATLLVPAAAHAQGSAVQYAKRPVIGLKCDLSKVKDLDNQLVPRLHPTTPEQRVCQLAVEGLQGRIRPYQLVSLSSYSGRVDAQLDIAIEQSTPGVRWTDGGSLDLHMRLNGASCASELCKVRDILTPSMHKVRLPGSLDRVRTQIEALLGVKEGQIYRWLQLPIQVLAQEKNGSVLTNLQYSTIQASRGDFFSVGSPPVPGVFTTWLRACSQVRPDKPDLIAGPKGKTCSSSSPSGQIPSGGQSWWLYYVGSEPRPLGSSSPRYPLPGMPTLQIPGLSLKEKNLGRVLEHYSNRPDGAPFDALLGGREPTSKDKNKLLDGLLEHYQRKIESGPLIAGPAYDVASALSAQASRVSDVESLCGTLVTARRAREALECVAGASVVLGSDRERIALQALGASPGLLPAEVREVTNLLPGLAALRAGTDACAGGSPQSLGIEEVLDTSRETGSASAVYYQLASTEDDEARRYCHLSRAAHTCLAAFGTSSPCAAPLSLARYLEAMGAGDTAKLDAAIQRLFTKQTTTQDPKCDWKEPFCRSSAGDVDAAKALLEMHLTLARLLDARTEAVPAAGPLSPRFHVQAAERLWPRVHPGTTLPQDILNTRLRAHLTTAVTSTTQGAEIAARAPTSRASAAPSAPATAAAAATGPAAPPPRPPSPSED